MKNLVMVAVEVEQAAGWWSKRLQVECIGVSRCGRLLWHFVAAAMAWLCAVTSVTAGCCFARLCPDFYVCVCARGSACLWLLSVSNLRGLSCMCRVSVCGVLVWVLWSCALCVILWFTDLEFWVLFVTLCAAALRVWVWVLFTDFISIRFTGLVNFIVLF